MVADAIGPREHILNQLRKIWVPLQKLRGKGSAQGRRTDGKCI